MLRRRYDKRIRLVLILLTTATALLCIEIARQMELPKLLEAIEAKAYDLRMSIPLAEATRRPSKDIALIVFDDPSMALYEDEYGTWPWPRSVHAEMIQFLNRHAKPRLIAYDLLFLSSRKTEKAQDQQLINTFINSPNVLLAMNLDQFLQQTRSLGKELKPQQRLLLQSVAVPVTNQLNRNSAKELTLDATGFFEGPHSTFNNFRPLIEPLYRAGQRVHLINHSRDEDGVSRANALLFRYRAPQPVKTKYLPVRCISRTGVCLDRMSRRVSQAGWLLDETGQMVQQEQDLFLPQMALRMLEVLARQKAQATHQPWQPPQYTLTPNGALRFGNRTVPLSADGRFYLNWYNVNIDREQWESVLTGYLYPQWTKLLQQPQTPAVQIQVLAVEQQIEQGKAFLKQSFTPKLYPMVSAARLIEAMHHDQAGKLTATDRQLIDTLRNKIVMVGSLAVSSFDMKTTPTSRVMPGLVQQAVIFDNLYQNKGYIHRASPNTNRWIALALCVLTLACIWNFRAAWMGLAAAAGALIAYLCINLWLFKQTLLWLDVVVPGFAILGAITLGFVLKYVSRDRDYERTYQLATTDGLTGLYNHRYFQDFLKDTLDACARSKRPGALLLVDIDFFKKFNDTHGHQAGDMVLRAVAQKLKTSVRADDLVARYGGEEMALVLPDTDRAAALEVAQKLVRNVGGEPYPITGGVEVAVTISVGVSLFPLDGMTATDLIEIADEGLYRAKEAGRNRVGTRPNEAAEAMVAAQHPHQRATDNPFLLLAGNSTTPPTLTSPGEPPLAPTSPPDTKA
jgi:diguanylate cyclase (GGDEF)-like protein